MRAVKYSFILALLFSLMWVFPETSEAQSYMHTRYSGSGGSFLPSRSQCRKLRRARTKKYRRGGFLGLGIGKSKKDKVQYRPQTVGYYEYREKLKQKRNLAQQYNTEK